MVLKTIKNGFAQVWANKKIVLIYYLTNLFFALFITVFFRSALSKFLGQSLASSRVFESLDMDIVFEFFKYKSDSISIVFLLFVLISILNRLFLLFLSGGAFAIFDSERPFSSKQFWGSAAHFSGRFLRLALLFLPFLVLFMLLPQIYNFFERIIFGDDPYQNITFWGGWIKVALRYLSLLLFGLLFEYSRIFTVIYDEKKMRTSLAAGLQFIYKNFIFAILIALILAVIGIMGLAIYSLIVYFIPSSNIILLFLVFVLQQFYFFFRTFLKLTIYASQMYFYKTITSEAEPVMIAGNTKLSNFES